MERYAGTQAVARALRVLGAFTDQKRSWTLSPLAAEVGLNKTTTHRLLSALEAEGFVVRDGERYRLGPELIVLGERALRATGLREAARPELEALAQELGESATLEILDGAQTLIVDEAAAKSLLGAAAELGTRWPAHATATGKVLLAALLDDGGALPGPLTARTERTIVEEPALMRELERARRRGWASNVGELEKGFVAIGAPVRDRRGRVVAAVGIGGPRSRLTDARIPTIGERVREAAERVSKRLGATEGAG